MLSPNPLRSVARGVRNAVAVLRTPTYVPPGHFYSPVTNRADVARAVGWRGRDPVGVDLRADEQVQLAQDLGVLWRDPDRWSRYTPHNREYGAADAAVLRGMLRRVQPKRVLEVSSGYSTAIMLDTADAFGLDVQVTCVEPYPDRLYSVLRAGDHVEVLPEPVQDLPLDQFSELQAGDLLFIDSTHVVKPGSDVAWLYLHVLPTLATGVLVHVHDAFWPFEYPVAWLEQRRDWTELYLLRAMLTGTAMWQIELFSSWLWATRPDLVPEPLRAYEPGSIWLRKVS